MARRSKPYSLYEQKERQRRKKSDLARTMDKIDREIRKSARTANRISKSYAKTTRMETSKSNSSGCLVGIISTFFLFVGVSTAVFAVLLVLLFSYAFSPVLTAVVIFAIITGVAWWKIKKDEKKRKIEEQNNEFFEEKNENSDSAIENFKTSDISPRRGS